MKLNFYENPNNFKGKETIALRTNNLCWESSFSSSQAKYIQGNFVQKLVYGFVLLNVQLQNVSQ